MCVSIILVACLTSLITSDIVDPSVDIYQETVAVVGHTYEEFLARKIVNVKRTRKNTVRFNDYLSLMKELEVNEDLFAGLVDHTVLSVMQKEMKEHKLGEIF